MLEVFCKDMPSIIFEPIFVMGIAGGLLALVLYRKERSVLYWFIACSLGFMIVWRVAMQIISERYAEILIFPMVIATVYFIFQTGNIWRILPALPEKYTRYLPICCMTVLVLVCVGKNLRFDGSMPITETTTALKAELPEDALVYLADSSLRWQIEYFLGKEVKYVPWQEGDTVVSRCRMIIDEAENLSAGSVYIFVAQRSKDALISAEDMQVNAADWQMVCEGFFNKKHTKSMRVYKYTISK